MKIKKYLLGAMMAVVVAISCSPDPSLYPLPYDSRATGSYLRAYQIKSTTWDFDDLANSGFEGIYESVDKNFGADLKEIRFYATHRSGSSGLITDEVLVKTITQAEIATLFAKVPEPTYSEYLRSSAIKVTFAETQAALSTLVGVDPDGVNGVDLPQCTGIFPKTCPAVAYPGALAANDRVIFRIAIVDKQDRVFTVANPQTTVSPSLGNPNEANLTPNLTGGLFYASPMLFNMTVVRTTTTGDPNAYTGTYTMTQVARWQPDHSAAQHQSFPQAWIDQFVFGTTYPQSTPAIATDSTQTVTLSKVTGGLPSQRQFTAKYRGQDVTYVINLENIASGLSAAAISTMAAAPPAGFGMTGAASANLGVITVPLMNTGVDCTGTREFYNVTPLGGAFAGIAGLPWGLPRATVPNRGAFRNDQTGLVAGQTLCIGIDDDADEYGRRNGYCNWYTRIQLTLTKQ